MAHEKKRTKMGILDQFKKLVPEGENSEYGIMVFANFENECQPGGTCKANKKLFGRK